jgi:hypothetical protein
MRNRWGAYKKLHKWPGLIISVFLLYYGLTGIFMNHRHFFSGIDIDRDILPEIYKYANWNNAAIKGNIILNPDSILVYGNIGVWLTDSGFRDYQSFNYGFPKGSDNRKIFDLHQSADGEIYAATLFGLYAYDRVHKSWISFPINDNNERFTGIESIGDTIYAINRSYVFIGKLEGIQTDFMKTELPAPEGFTDKVGLFETIWQLHSGEIFGIPGKLFVDLLGLITVFLSATGIIYFFFPGWIKLRKQNSKSTESINRINKWTLKWHNQTGAWFFGFLIFLFFTGIFLRPPLLIAISNAKVSPIKYSHLDQPNPWHDKLRDILFDKDRNILLLSTTEGICYTSKYLEKPEFFKIQPPISVMGINTFEKFNDEAYLIGSFSGLFLWNPTHPEIFNYANGKIVGNESKGRPVGEVKITGTIKDCNKNLYMVDYDQGIFPVRHNKRFPEISQAILSESKMSLWNLSLEIHTGRIFQAIIGDFYILIVPHIGIASVIIVFSGYMLWRRKYKKTHKIVDNSI